MLTGPLATQMIATGMPERRSIFGTISICWVRPKEFNFQVNIHPTMKLKDPGRILAVGPSQRVTSHRTSGVGVVSA
jgi:hypothetical protein